MREVFNHIWHVCALTLRMDVLLDVWELKHPWTDVYLYLSKHQKNIVPYLFSTISQITNPLQGVFTICLTPSILDLDKKKKCRDASWNQVNAAPPLHPFYLKNSTTSSFNPTHIRRAAQTSPITESFKVAKQQPLMSAGTQAVRLSLFCLFTQMWPAGRSRGRRQIHFLREGNTVCGLVLLYFDVGETFFLRLRREKTYDICSCLLHFRNIFL